MSVVSRCRPCPQVKDCGGGVTNCSRTKPSPEQEGTFAKQKFTGGMGKWPLLANAWQTPIGRNSLKWQQCCVKLLILNEMLVIFVSHCKFNDFCCAFNFRSKNTCLWVLQTTKIHSKGKINCIWSTLFSLTFFNTLQNFPIRLFSNFISLKKMNSFFLHF